MPLGGKHLFGEMSDTRVSFIEKNISYERKQFLKQLLEFNGFTVLAEMDKKKAETDPDTYTVGVTDLVFNPTIWIYNRKLKTSDGRLVTPEYWDQKTEKTKPQYWEAMWNE